MNHWGRSLVAFFEQKATKLRPQWSTPPNSGSLFFLLE